MIAPMETRRCTGCGEVKTVDQFYKKGGTRGGYRSKCKPCYIPETNKSTKAWRENNPDKVRAQVKRWNENNPGARLIIENRRRARKVDAVLGPIDWSMLRTITTCYLCSEPLSGPTCMDHIIPLSRGGAHCTENLLPTHRLCNERKQALLLSELDWYSGPTDLGVAL